MYYSVIFATTTLLKLLSVKSSFTKYTILCSVFTSLNLLLAFDITEHVVFFLLEEQKKLVMCLF